MAGMYANPMKQDCVIMMQLKKSKLEAHKELHHSWSSTCSKQSRMPGEYLDMSSNMKHSNLNTKTKSILMKSSVHYHGQEKILSMPDDSNSVRDRGPQHVTKQQRAEAKCAPQQQNRNALEGQMHPREWTSGSREAMMSVQLQPKSSAHSHQSSRSKECRQDEAVTSSMVQPQQQRDTCSHRSNALTQTEHEEPDFYTFKNKGSEEEEEVLGYEDEEEASGYEDKSNY
ncbi:hypothetical protein L208DRAFT_1381167 [Tricholoma matsutake]|nr:hypothetical protein L208DRAFT_1381167 [Tricholoma matsutake 945]